MTPSSLEMLWLGAVAGLIAYPVGDLLNWWIMEPLVVLTAACALLLAGRNLPTKVGSHG